MSSTTTGNSKSQRDIVNSNQSFLMNEQMIKEGEEIISRKGENLLKMSCKNLIEDSGKQLHSRAESTGFDSGNCSSDQQSQMASLAILEDDSKVSLASKRFEVDGPRVSKHSEFGVPDCSIHVQDFCETNVRNVLRENTDSIASNTLLYDILHSPGELRVL